MKAKNWHEEVIFNRRGLKLAALLRRADPVSPVGSGDSMKSRRPHRSDQLPLLVIVCHGFSGSKEGGGGAEEMADELAGLGFATLLFDFTGCGESEGLWEEITLSRQVDDLGAAVEWARLQGYRRIILNGRSFGGATVLAYAAIDQQIAAVCTWAAVARPQQLFGEFFGEGNAPGPSTEIITLSDSTGTIRLQRGFFQDLQRHDLLSYAAGISPRLLLLIHGSADEVVPVEDAQLLYAAANEPKKLALVKGADHRFTDHRKQVWMLFFDWLREQR